MSRVLITLHVHTRCRRFRREPWTYDGHPAEVIRPVYVMRGYQTSPADFAAGDEAMRPGLTKCKSMHVGHVRGRQPS
jgi:hypothetical protein